MRNVLHVTSAGAAIVLLYGVSLMTLYSPFGWIGVGVVVFPFILPVVPVYLAFHGIWWPLVALLTCGIGYGLTSR